MDNNEIGKVIKDYMTTHINDGLKAIYDNGMVITKCPSICFESNSEVASKINAELGICETETRLSYVVEYDIFMQLVTYSVLFKGTPMEQIINDLDCTKISVLDRIKYVITNN